MNKKVSAVIASIVLAGIASADLVTYQATVTNEATPALWYKTDRQNQGSAGSTYVAGVGLSASAADYWSNANSAFGLTNDSTKGAPVSSSTGLFATGQKGTVCFLFKTPETLSGYVSLFNQGHLSTHASVLEVGINGSTLSLITTAGAMQTNNLGTLTGDTWYYYAMTWDLSKPSDDMTWYYGDAESSLDTGNVTISAAGASDRAIYIGGRPTSNPFLGGLFQNIAVYETNLSDSAIQSQFNAIPEPATLGLFMITGGSLLAVRKSITR